jgi:hypothetical protein
MSSAHLPQEICDVIVGLLDCADAESDIESRIETLKSCALISKAWTASAQRHIFHTIHIVNVSHGSADTMPQSRGALLSQITQHSFSAVSRKAPDSKSNANSDSNLGLSSPLAKLCETLRDSHHLRPFIKKLEIHISTFSGSRDAASSLLREWRSFNELALFSLFQIETLPELRHLSLQLPYRREITALGAKTLDGSLFFEVFRRFLSLKARSDAPITHLSLGDMTFDYPSQLGELLEAAGSRSLKVLILNNLRVLAADKSSSEEENHIGKSFSGLSASYPASTNVPDSSSSLRHLSLVNIPSVYHEKILYWMLCRSLASKSDPESQAFTLHGLKSFYYEPAALMISPLGGGSEEGNPNAPKMLQEFIRSVSSSLKRIYVGCMKRELIDLGLTTMPGTFQPALNLSLCIESRLITYIIIGSLFNLTSLTLHPITPAAIPSHYVRFRNTLLFSLTSFAQAAATNISEGTKFRCLRLGVIRIPIFLGNPLMMNMLLGSVFTANKRYWLQFDEAFKALAAAAPDKVSGPRVILIFNVLLDKSLMPRIQECLPLLYEMGLVDIVVRSAKEFKREVKAEIDDMKYLET